MFRTDDYIKTQNLGQIKSSLKKNLQTVFMPECRKKGFLSQHAELALIKANIQKPYGINTFSRPPEPASQTGQNATVFTG